MMGFLKRLKSNFRTRRRLRRRIKQLERQVGQLSKDLEHVPEINKLETLEQDKVYVISTENPENVMQTLSHLKQVVPWTLPVILVVNRESAPKKMDLASLKRLKEQVDKALEEEVGR